MERGEVKEPRTSLACMEYLESCKNLILLFQNYPITLARSTLYQLVWSPPQCCGLNSTKSTINLPHPPHLFVICVLRGRTYSVDTLPNLPHAAKSISSKKVHIDSFVETFGSRTQQTGKTSLRESGSRAKKLFNFLTTLILSTESCDKKGPKSPLLHPRKRRTAE